MAPPIKTVLIIGAGGAIGAPILRAVSEAGFDVSILSRKSSKSNFDSKSRKISISDDYPHDELVAAFRGQDAVVCTINAFELKGQKRLIDAAIQAGVYRFIPSEFGGHNRNSAATDLVPLFEDKRRIIEYLQQREDKITWTSIPTGLFYDWALKHHFSGFDIPNRTAKLTDNGTTKFSTTTIRQVGEWVATVLSHAEETENYYAAVESFQVSQLEILATLQKVTGDEFKIEHESGEDLIQRSQQALAAGDRFGEFGLIQAVLFVEGRGGNFHEAAVASMSKLGVSPLDLEEETRRAVQAL